MIVVAIIGVLASVAIPAFDKYIRKSKTSEAKTFVKKIYDGARAYYMEPNFGTKSVTPVAPQFPGVLGSVGSAFAGGGSLAIGGSITGHIMAFGAGSGCCAVTNASTATEKCAPTSSMWASSTFSALQFSVEDPSFYAYGYRRVADPGVAGQPAGVTEGFVAGASGDLDCDSTRSHFAMYGWVSPETDGPAGTSAISKWNELE